MAHCLCLLSVPPAEKEVRPDDMFFHKYYSLQVSIYFIVCAAMHCVARGCFCADRESGATVDSSSASLASDRVSITPTWFFFASQAVQDKAKAKKKKKGEGDDELLSDAESEDSDAAGEECVEINLCAGQGCLAAGL